MLITTADNHTGLSMLYIFHMFLFDHEADSAFCPCAGVSEAPKGLYLIGDVALDEYNDAGNIDIGSSMQTAYGVMRECLEELGGYAFDLQAQPYYEEHIPSGMVYRTAGS
ncbi:MAG TPA: hypothetical protein VN512_08510 [Clostridia bacterium]|nr:hypothetical protein [Clostridia bacterium]